MNVVMTADKRDEPRQLFTVDVSGQHLMHSLELRLRKTCGAHVSSSISCYLTVRDLSDADQTKFAAQARAELQVRRAE